MNLPANCRTVQELVERYYESLYRYAFRLSGSGADAEDLTQDAFCQAQRNWSQLREYDRAKAWLFSILRNAYLHRLRSARRQLTLPLEVAGEIADRPPEPLPEIDPQRLQTALQELPEEFRTPLILFYFEDFSYRDIADQMALPLGTVMSRLARAKAHLRGLLLAPAAVSTRQSRRADNGL
jgi:RNA polymerase sigma-70 factor, ECF subfamily